VDCALKLSARGPSDTALARLQYATPQFFVHQADGPVQPGAYGRVVTLGSFRAIKVDATFSAIAPGDVLVSSPNPGFAMKQQPIGDLNGVPVFQSGGVIGKALGALESGTGAMPVLVQSR
jgi:hypothetical protein